MICDIRISEKSFGAKTLFSNVNFSIDDDEKVALIGRNGIGKSTLLHILSGKDSDYDGEVIFRRGVSVVSTLQEHFNDDQTVIDYVLEGLPEHKELSNIIRNYPSIMNDDLKLIDKYTKALERFTNLGYFTVEDKIREEFKNFQIPGLEDRKLASLSGGQKRIVEIIKVMHSNTHLALFDEPTNHMDYVAKRDFIEFIKNKKQAMLIVSHDRDVLKVVDKIVEIKDGKSKIYNGNYDFYLKQNSSTTANEMNDYENVKRRIANLKIKHAEYKRLK
ncbi:MAG: ATP-binding cassette domain-containing protein, partial [Candidatus Saccharibacteria bacterium]